MKQYIMQAGYMEMDGATFFPTYLVNGLNKLGRCSFLSNCFLIATRYLLDGPQVVAKWLPLVTKWLPSGCQMVAKWLPTALGTSSVYKNK